MSIKYKRVLLKLSGESLAGVNKIGIDFDVVTEICKSIKCCVEKSVQIGVVVGGGNFWRGRSNEGIDRTCADYVGMTATVMNSLIISEALSKLGVSSTVQTSINMQPIAEYYSKKSAVEYLNNGEVLIFGGGTGSPFFSTDTAASLRASEIKADIVLKATMVDGVYDCDPKLHSNCIKYDKLTFSEVLEKELRVMDATAILMCKENNIPIRVFNIDKPENIVKVISGEPIGTLVNN